MNDTVPQETTDSSNQDAVFGFLSNVVATAANAYQRATPPTGYAYNQTGQLVPVTPTAAATQTFSSSWMVALLIAAVVGIAIVKA